MNTTQSLMSPLFFSPYIILQPTSVIQQHLNAHTVHPWRVNRLETSACYLLSSGPSPPAIWGLFVFRDIGCQDNPNLNEDHHMFYGWKARLHGAHMPIGTTRL